MNSSLRDKFVCSFILFFSSSYFFCSNVDRVALRKRLEITGGDYKQQNEKNVDDRNPLKMPKPPCLIRNQGLLTFMQEMIHNFARIKLK